MDHIFTMVATGGYHAEMFRMAAEEPLATVEHNFKLLAASAEKKDMTVVWSRGELQTADGGWDMGKVVMVS